MHLSVCLVCETKVFIYPLLVFLFDFLSCWFAAIVYSRHYFLFINIYLFIWLLWVLSASHWIFDLCCHIQDLVLWPGTEPGSPASRGWCLNHWTTREVPPCLNTADAFSQSATFMQICYVINLVDVLNFDLRIWSLILEVFIYTWVTEIFLYCLLYSFNFHI